MKKRISIFFARLDCVFLMDGNGFSWKANNARRILNSPLENNGELQWASNHASVFAEASLAKLASCDFAISLPGKCA